MPFILLTASCSPSVRSIDPASLDPYPGEPLISLVPQERIESRLEAVPDSNTRRGDKLRRLFGEVGCGGENYKEQTVRPMRPPNLICELPGKARSTIVVGAHYDKVDEGDGVADNWSGASLLPSLYRSLASSPRFRTYRFVAFTDEDLGLVGSKYYVKNLKKADRRAIRAMVNLDVIGLRPSRAWISQIDRELFVNLARTALTLGSPLEPVDIDRVGITDSESFRIRRIPATTVTSIDPDQLTVINGPNDKIELIDRASYYESYRLIANFLAVLDDALRTDPDQ